MGVVPANEERHLQLNTARTPMLLGALRHVDPLDCVFSDHYWYPRVGTDLCGQFYGNSMGLGMCLSKLLVICKMLQLIGAVDQGFERRICNFAATVFPHCAIIGLVSH